MKIISQWLGCCLLISLPAYAIEFSETEKSIIQLLAANPNVQPYDPSNEVSGNPKAIALGKQLFFSKRLSRDGKVACASCHIPDKGWSDGKMRAQIRSQTMNKNSPTLWNVAQNRWFFWDGRADSLWAQATASIEAHNEINSDRTYLTRWLVANPSFKQSFESFFGELKSCVTEQALPQHAKPTQQATERKLNQAWKQMSACQQKETSRVLAGLAKLIAAYEETIVSQNSLFDRYAHSLKQAKPINYPIAAKRGLKHFIAKDSCISCHSGSNFSDSEFHNLFFIKNKAKGGRYTAIGALKRNPFNQRGEFSALDKDDFNKLDYIYKNIAFKQSYKTPTLRNLRASAPYMHDGRLLTLENVMDYYGSLRELSQSKRADLTHVEETLSQLFLDQQQQADLIAFLETLNDDSFLDSLTKEQRTGQ